eukprot:SAG11_NODE_36689_length_260_cov_0.950311_1_plen_68_part_01
MQVGDVIVERTVGAHATRYYVTATEFAQAEHSSWTFLIPMDTNGGFDFELVQYFSVPGLIPNVVRSQH